MKFGSGDLENVAAEDRSSLNIGDHISRFDCIWLQ